MLRWPAPLPAPPPGPAVRGGCVMGPRPRGRLAQAAACLLHRRRRNVAPRSMVVWHPQATRQQDAAGTVERREDRPRKGAGQSPTVRCLCTAKPPGWPVDRLAVGRTYLVGQGFGNAEERVYVDVTGRFERLRWRWSTRDPPPTFPIPRVWCAGALPGSECEFKLKTMRLRVLQRVLRLRQLIISLARMRSEHCGSTHAAALRIWHGWCRHEVQHVPKGLGVLPRRPCCTAALSPPPPPVHLCCFTCRLRPERPAPTTARCMFVLSTDGGPQANGGRAACGWRLLACCFALALEGRLVRRAVQC